jgi:hypothetical protein
MDLILICPHCLDNIIINENDLNCCIFRHAIYKKNFNQISPHTSEEKCNRLITKNKVFGCAKPSKYVNNRLEICDYL